MTGRLVGQRHTRWPVAAVCTLRCDAHDDPDGLLARIEDEGHREALRSRYADLMRHRGQLTLLPKEPTP